ncbi:proline-rich protein 36 isoform X1 [Poecilia reticulata]|uniref:proline-rich protein 36 isoform X1 n=1 Tax=Poecilia reticulata TaxID=8081 RepID=UPI0004A2B413|nr:PREDICTED: proline-rich protein 36-like isoform X1 [Poecilia reticulata]
MDSLHVFLLQEEEGEELAGLRAPPTLSITEEILQFISQSRVMEGLSTTNQNQNQDPPGEVRCPADPTGPLPAVASSPEQRLLAEPDQEGEDLSKSITDPDPADEGPDGSGEVAGVKGQQAAETGPGSHDEEEQTPEKPSSSDLQPCISENTDSLTEPEPQSPGPVPQPGQPGTIQRYQAPKKGSTLTNKDKKIIEKIRSYYEAAEAEEDEAEDEEEQREGARRRSSFSQIPSGLVKESVSRFTASGHQVEPTLDDVEEPLRCPEGEPESPDQPSPPRQNPDSEPRTFPEPEIQEEECRGSPEEPEDGENVAVKTTEEEEGLALPEQNDGERTIEPQPGQAEPSIHRPEQEPGQTAKQGRTQSTWARTRTRDPPNLERVPSQSKVGRWSRHSKIVSANRALFEGMGSDVTGIGLFETNPVVDPVLMENSERILSKVQTLARMYSAKASTMKGPLLHKRVSTIRTQAWVSARLSGLSAQNRDRSPSQQEKESEAQTGSETKTQTHVCSGPIQNQTQIQEGRPEPQTDDPQQEEPWPSVTRTRDQQDSLSRPRESTCSRTPGQGPCDQNQAVSSRTGPQPQGSSRDSAAEEEEEDEAAAVSPEPEEPQEAGGRPDQDEGRRVDAAGGQQTSGDVSAPPAVAEGNGPDRDAAAGRHEEDQGGRSGSIPTPTESRTTGEPGLTEEPSPRPAGSTGRPDTVDPMDHTTAAQKDEAPPSPCWSDSLLAGARRASAVPWTSSSSPETERRKPDEPLSGPSLRTTSPVPSVFNAGLVHRSPSPLRSAPPCSSPFRHIPVSSPTPASPAAFTSALSCLSPTPSTVSSVRSPTPSLTLCGNSSPSRGTPSSPTPPLHSPTCPSSAFSRSLAASHISQSISQSMSKKGTARQQAPTIKLMNPSPSSTPDLRRRTPSPNPPTAQLGPSVPAYTQLGCTKEGYQHPRCPPSSVRSSCLSPPSVSQCPPSPSAGLRQPRCSSPSPRPSFLHSKCASPQLGKKNINNNNSAGYVGGAVSNGGCLGADGRTEPLQSQYPLWSGSHNRVARPFSASEPSSRVQSPTPSPTPASFVCLFSPPPQHNYSSPMANKPPNPRSSRVGGSHNHLDLRLDLPRASFDGSSCGDSSACVSPRILSPPPIGVPVWTNNVAAPQPRNPRHSASPSLFPSTSGSQTYRIPSSPLPSQIARRPLSSTLSDRPPSPARSAQRRSWADFGQRSLGFTGSIRGSFEQQESCPISPSSGWSSHSSSLSCLSPRAGLQCPLSPTRLTSGKGAISGQHFTSVPWPDVRELSSKYNGEDSPETSPTAPMSPIHLIASPCPTDGQADWGEPQLEEGSCRTQLICAYVSRPSHQQTVSPSSCLIFSPSGLTSPPPESHHFQRQPQVTASPPPPSTLSPSPIISSPLPKQGSQKASYATTVNLQIAGSGRITSFSTAQVSLTQTLQGGAGPPGSQDQMARRVSINGLSPVPQGCNRP